MTVLKRYTGSAWEVVGAVNNPPACRVYNNASQSIPHNTLTAVTFNSERYDTDTMHDTVTNNSRITFTTAGLYAITANVQLASATDYTEFLLGIRADGATYILQHADRDPGTLSFARVMAVATQYKFTAGQYVELIVRQQNGATAARNSEVGGNWAPEFAATWVGTG